MRSIALVFLSCAFASASASISVERMGGFTNETFLLTHLAEQEVGACIMRVGNPSSALLGIDRVKELKHMQNFSLGYAPPVLSYHQRDDILVTQCVKGVHLPPEFLLKDGQKMRIFIDALRKIHAQRLAEERDGGDLYPLRAVREYIDTVKRMQPSLKLDEVEAFLRALPSVDLWKPCMCHNDLVWTNLLWEEDALHIIDWEYSDWGDCYYDLASFCIEQDCSNQQIVQVLALYFGEKFLVDYSKFYLMSALYSLRNFLWSHIMREI